MTRFATIQRLVLLAAFALAGCMAESVEQTDEQAAESDVTGASSHGDQADDPRVSSGRGVVKLVPRVESFQVNHTEREGPNPVPWTTDPPKSNGGSDPQPGAAGQSK